MNPQQSKSILVPTFKSVTLIDPSSITHIQAMQNYCKLHKDDGSHILASMSFGKVMKVLEPHDFFQCHKSYALKLNKVVRYHSCGKAELIGDAVVPVARRRKKDFLDAIVP